MRLVYVPEKLTFFDLLELREIPLLLGDKLQGDVRHDSDIGQLSAALTAADSLFSVAWNKHDRYTGAMILLYKAEILRRMQRWEEALEHVQRALNWLRPQITQVAAYNYAVALYFAGLIHFVLRAEDKAILAFMEAQEILVESERYWGFENNLQRVATCQDLAKWISHLLPLQLRQSSGEWELIVPVYELVNQTPVRTGATIVTPFHVLPPQAAMDQYLPANYKAVDIEALPFFRLRPNMHYLALRIPAGGEPSTQSWGGDVLLIETISTNLSTPETLLNRDISFVRRMDGRVLFGPYYDEQTREPGGANSRVLLGGEKELE